MATLGTEEDLRARVIAYLGTLGIGPSQLRFEGLVRLQLGRVPVDLGVDPDVRMERHGHYDILVTNQSGRNLLVAELKRPGLALTEDDAKQAVSYARLLMQMPPFAWLTNGLESHLYDVWSAKEVTPDNLVCTWSEDAWNPQFSQEDLRLREEALRFFIGYSQENVTLFCRAQQTLRMANLRGDPGTRTRKYLPEVYVPRRSVRRSFAEFLASPAAVFVLAGPSGIGKTNELCALAEESGAAHLSLFFSGGELASAPGAVLADEFSWSFSDQLSLPLLCERLASIARASCRNVLIFLDAIDECEVQLFEKLAADLAFHFAKYAGVIRLVVSLKTTQWERFAHFADGPSSLARLSFREAPAGSERSEQPGRRWGVPSVELVPLEPDESAEAISRYATCFGLRGRFGRGMEDRVRDPFELRIASEVCADGARALDELSSGDPLLLQHYIEEKLAKIAPARRSSLRCALRAVGAALVDANSATAEFVESHSVSERLALAQSGCAGWSELPPEAFDSGLLVREFDSSGRTRVSFQYDRVRDHVVAFQVLELDALEGEQFSAALPATMKHAIRRAALKLYLGTPIDVAHQAAVREYARTCAERFLATYVKIRTALGSHLRRHVPPRVEGSIGLAYTLYGVAAWSYGFFGGCGSQEPIVQCDDLWNAWRSGPRQQENERLRSVDGVWWQEAWQFLAQPERLAADRALDALQRAIAAGCLDEADGAVLDHEKVFAVVGGLRSVLARSLPRSRAASELGFDLVPLDLQDLQWRVHAELGARQANVDVAVRQGTHAEITEAMTRARQDARAGRRFFHPKNHVPVPALNVLAEALERLLVKERTLTSHYLVPPNSAPPSERLTERGIEEEYDDLQLCEFIARVCAQQIDACNWVIDSNFPGLKDLFPSCDGIEHLLVLYRRPKGPWQLGMEGLVHLAQLHADDPWPLVPGAAIARGKRCRIQVHVESESLRIANGEVVTPSSRVPLHHGYSATGFKRLLEAVNPPPLGWHGEVKYYLMPLRSYAYTFVRDALKQADSASVLAAATLGKAAATTAAADTCAHET